MNRTSPSLTTGELKPANVAELEKELASLWQSAAQDPETRHAVTRSCSLTLLVYVESEEEGRQALDLIDRVSFENPCRAVIMIAEPAASAPGLSAWISARCHLAAAGGKEVCCEQVSVLARGEAVAGLDQIVMPMMVPGLPVYLWWRASRFAPPAYLELILRSADRVLVDSARFPDTSTDLPCLVGGIRNLSRDLVFTDLNWARLTPWRELIAQCFDSPETRPYLDQLSEVRIEYEQRSPRISLHRAQSLLLTAWLATRLAWQPVAGSPQPGKSGPSFLFRCGERSVRVDHIPRHFEGGGAGVCFSIALKTGGSAPGSFSLRRGPDGRTALARRELPGLPAMERAVGLRVFDETELLNGEIRFAGRDRVYEETLGMLARLTSSSK